MSTAGDAELRVRVASRCDAELFASFSCAVDDASWRQEVEQFVRRRAVSWATAADAAARDRRVLILTRGSDELVAVAAHEHIALSSPTRRQLDGSKLVVVAVATSWQGLELADGRRASEVIMTAAMNDIMSRQPPRNARALAVIHRDNTASLRLCYRFGFTEEIHNPDPSYRRVVTAAAV